jgi:hypothetical protein
MKKILFFLVTIAVLAFMFGCEKEKLETNYDAKFRIDSLKQDSVLFAHLYYIKGKVRVFYTVVNNGDVLLNCYRYTINAMSCDSIYYQIAESHYYTIPAKSERHDSTKIGIGDCRVAYARIDNTMFQ